MKTWYIYARLNKETLRITATLYNKPPYGYYPLCTQNARNKAQAIINFMISISIIRPPKLNFANPHHKQLSFIQNTTEND